MFQALKLKTAMKYPNPKSHEGPMLTNDDTGKIKATVISAAKRAGNWQGGTTKDLQRTWRRDMLQPLAMLVWKSSDFMPAVAAHSFEKCIKGSEEEIQMLKTWAQEGWYNVRDEL